MDVYEELKNLIKKVLEEESFKDSNGYYYDEIYKDYRDEISDSAVAEILKADDPMLAFNDHIEEVYFDEKVRIEDEMYDKILENEAIAELVEKNNLSDTDVRDSLFDLWYVKLPYEDFLKQEVCMDVVLDTGDMNYDFTCNILTEVETVDEFDSNSSLLWLCEQQGVTRQELFDAMQKGSAHSDKVIGLKKEIENLTDKLKEYGLKTPYFNESVIHSGAYLHYTSLCDELGKFERYLEKLNVRYAKNDITYDMYLKLHFDRFDRLDPMSEEQFNSKKEGVLKSIVQEVANVNERISSIKLKLEGTPDYVAIAGLQRELRKAKTELYEISENEDYKKAEFINSVINEVYNTYGMAALTFLVKMPLVQVLDLKEVINSEKGINDFYDYEQRKGTASVTLDKNVECGLMDSWNGKGSLFEIKLIKDVEVPIKALYDVVPDDKNGGYGFMEIYGSDSSMFKTSLKKISASKEQELDNVIKSATAKSEISRAEGTVEKDEPDCSL